MSFTQQEAISYTGSAAEQAITLDRGYRQLIKKIDVGFPAASATAEYKVIFKGSASTANERDQEHADSHGVLMGTQRLANGTTIEVDEHIPESSGLRIYLNLGSASGTVNLNINYE